MNSQCNHVKVFSRIAYRDSRCLVLVIVATCAARATAGQELAHDARSVTHPVATKPVAPQPYAVSNLPLAAVWESGEWRVFSRNANLITCTAQHGQELWLGTEYGVKSIDRARNVVRHFTRLDGLSEESILAIAAEGESVWCAVREFPAGVSRIALCQLDRKSMRWQPLRSSARATVRAPSVSAIPPLNNVVLAASSDSVCFGVSPVPRESETVVAVFDRLSKNWLEIGWDRNLRADYPYLNLQAAWTDRDGVWLATNAGMLRYRFREKQWQRYLAEWSIAAGVRDNDGFWLAAQPRTTDASTAKRWILARLLTKTGEMKEYAPPSQSYTYTGTDAIPIGASLQAGEVWVTTWARSSSPSQAGFHAFDPRTGRWQVLSGGKREELALVPDAALLHVAPSSTRATLLVTLDSKRFPDWFCAEDAELRAAVSTLESSGYGRFEDEAGGVWSVSNSNVLVRTDKGSGQTERYTVDIELPTNPGITGLALLGETLFVTTADGLQAHDLASGRWKPVIVPFVPFGPRSLLPTQGGLLLAGARSIVRFDPTSGSFSVVAQSAESFQLLGANEMGLWLSDNRGRLYHADMKAQRAEQVELSFPPGLAVQANSARPVAVAGTVIWYHLTLLGAPAHPAFIGYDMKVKEWTEAVRHPSYYSSSDISVPFDGESSYLSARADDQTVVIKAYHHTTAKWNVVTTPRFSSSLSLIAVDAASLWCQASPSAAELWEYNRTQQVWITHKCPEDFHSIGEVHYERHGNLFLIGTAHGLWQYQPANREWQQVPVPSRTGIQLNGLTGDARAIWSVCMKQGLRQQFVVRFDRRTNEWSLLEPRGLPPYRQSYPNLLSDGDSLWTYEDSAARYDSQSKQWQSLGPLLTQDANATVTVRRIVPDGKSIWLLLSGTVWSNVSGIATSRRIGFLARYDKESRQFDIHSPEGSDRSAGHNLLVEPKDVWVSTSDGVYRFDKSTQDWRKVEMVPTLMKPRGVWAERFVRTPTALWFLTSETIMRWTQPDGK